MAKKANREWATRSEAITMLAQNPNATADGVVALLFNSTPAQIAQDVARVRVQIAAQITARRAAEDAVIAAAKAAQPAQSSKPAAK